MQISRRSSFGLLVGLIHSRLPAKEIDVFDPIGEGHLPPRLVPGSLLVAAASLVGGFSLGPEVPFGILAGGVATWLSEKRDLDEETRRANILCGVMSAYGGLFSAPFAALIAAFELPHKQNTRFFSTLLGAHRLADYGHSRHRSHSGFSGRFDRVLFDARIWSAGSKAKSECWQRKRVNYGTHQRS